MQFRLTAHVSRLTKLGSLRGADMGLTTTARGDVTVVRVDGQLTVGNRQELKATVQAGVDAGGRKFLLDCTPTGYIDSSGLGALVTIAKRVREAGGQIRLAGLNDDLRSLFELTKLDTLFAIYPGVEEALQGF
jgi:anti-sigma B factor antagonist